MKKVCFITIGCRLNTSESDSLKSKFFSNYYEITEDIKEDCDVYVINTCSVTNNAGLTSLKVIKKAMSHGKNKLVVVTGCHEKELRDFNFEGVVLIPNEEKDQLFEKVDKIVQNRTENFVSMNSTGFNYEVPIVSNHTKAFIKIQDGCDNSCSFCKIPIYRGVARSREFDAVIKDIRDALNLEYKEVVLTGINLGRYDFEGKKLHDLIKAILEIKADFNLSISSIEPYGITEEFLSLYEDKRLKRHLHLCLQSGSDRILFKMRREYNTLSFKKIVNRLREIDPLFNISTDIIVGFNGEEEEDFEKSLEIVREMEFSHVHVFPYSRKEGTISSHQKELKVNHKTKKERVRTLMKLSEDIKKSYREKFIGVQSRVLVEKCVSVPDGVLLSGYNLYYLPVSFYLKNETKEIKNQFFEITPNSLDKDLNLYSKIELNSNSV